MNASNIQASSSVLPCLQLNGIRRKDPQDDKIRLQSSCRLRGPQAKHTIILRQSAHHSLACPKLLRTPPPKKMRLTAHCLAANAEQMLILPETWALSASLPALSNIRNTPRSTKNSRRQIKVKQKASMMAASISQWARGRPTVHEETSETNPQICASCLGQFHGTRV